MDMINPDTGTPLETSTLTVNPPPPEQPTLTMDSKQQLYVPMDIAEKRAAKFTAAFADINVPTNWSYQDYLHSIATGQEQGLRATTASAIDSIRSATVREKISQGIMAGQSPQELQALAQSINKPTDPNSVMEEKYASWYTDNLNTTNPGIGFWYDAYKQMPQEMKILQGLGEKTLSFRNYAVSLKEDVDQDLQKLKDSGSYGSYIWDFLKAGFQPYREVQFRGNVKDVGWFKGGLLSENVKAQADKLWEIDDFDEQKKQLSAIRETLRANPFVAGEFLDYVIGVSTAERYLGNTFSVAEIPTYAALAKGTARLARGVYVQRQVNRAFKSAIKDIEDAERSNQPPQVAAPAAAGDLDKATTEKLTMDVSKDMAHKSNPIDSVTEPLPNALRLDKEAGMKDPGNFGQTMTNQIKERYDVFIEKVQKTLEEVLKIERIPDFLAVKTAVAKVKESMKDLFKGFTVLDVGDPIWHPVTNTYHIPFHLGDNGGYFEYANTAHNFAQVHGLVPTHVTLLQEVNKFFGLESSKLTKLINETKAEIKAGPRMDADVHELNRHAVNLPNQLKALESKFDDLLSWHADKLTEPGIDKIKLKEGPGYTVEQRGNNQLPPVPKNHVRFYHGGSKYEGGPRWITPDYKYAKGYADKHPNSSSVHYVDIPEDSPHLRKSFDDTGTDQIAPYVHFEAPENIAKGLKPFGGVGNGGFTIEQQGRGYYIRYVKPLDETQSLIRESMLKTTESQAPKGIMKDFIGWLRTPEETQSFNERLNRKVATYANNRVEQALKAEAKEIQDLYKGRHNFSNKQWDEWERVVDLGRRLYDPETLWTDGQLHTGYWYKSPAEFERYFHLVNGHFPDAAQVHAYMSFKRIYEADRMFRNILLYRGASRVGAENHSIFAINHLGERTSSPTFAGVQRTALPGTSDTFLIMDRTLGNASIERGGTIAPKQLEKLKADILQGKRKVIEVYNPELRPLKGFDNVTSERIRFVITEVGGHEVKPLTADMLPRRGGGHVIYDYDHYIKQAIVRPEKLRNTLRHWYEGDTTVMPISNRAMGHKISDHLNQVRKYLIDKDEANAKRYTTAHLPMSWETVRKWFLGGRNGEEPRLNLHEPIQMVSRGKTINQMDNKLFDRYKDKNNNSTLVDGTRHGSLARQYQVDFSEARDPDLIYTINDTGSRGNPVYSYEPSKLIDVMPTLNRAIKGIANSMFMDDYKIFAVERWVREAKNHLNFKGHDPESEISSAPFYHFYNHEYLSGAELQDVFRLAQQSYKIKNFIGEQSYLDRILNQLSTRVEDSVYEALGPGKVAKGVELLIKAPLKVPPATAKILRTIAYHATMGFALPQLLAQSMTYAAILGVSGTSRAGPGTMAAFLHQSARLTPWLIKRGYNERELIDTFDKIASHPSFMIPGMSHFKPGEFAEAYDALKRTGFDIVGQEHAFLEKIYTPKPVTQGGSTFLNASSIFFKGAERNARFGSWYTAYLEFREKNPVGKLSNLDVQSILERADMLSGNMSRASRSLLQSGPLAFTTQFLGYQMRMAELFTGTRMGGTGFQAAMVRARWLFTFGLAFGFPNAAGVSGVPAGDFFRQYALENGYVVGDSVVNDLFMNGVPAVAMAWITGGGDFQKGTQYNFGQRYGVPGFDMIRDALASDKTFMKIMQGAAGSQVETAYQQTSNIRRWMWDILTGSNETYPLKVADLLDPIIHGSTVTNSTWRTIEAINTGNWLTKNGAKLQTDVSWQKALFMGISGLQDQAASDEYLKSLSLTTRTEVEKYVMKEFIKEFHRALDALEKNDASNWEFYAKRAESLMIRYGYPLEKRNQLLAIASEGYESLINRIDKQFYTHNLPTTSDRNKMFDAWQRTQQLEKKRQQ